MSTSLPRLLRQCKRRQEQADETLRAIVAVLERLKGSR
jgi:hypothetical protein